jgi:hypothetical protein
LNGREIGILAPIAIACFVLGVYPNVLIHSIQPAADRQILARVFNQSDTPALAESTSKPLHPPAVPAESRGTAFHAVIVAWASSPCMHGQDPRATNTGKMPVPRETVTLAAGGAR